MVNPLWVPDRQQLIWIDCSPQVGQEMKNVHPFLVLSPNEFNHKTSLVLGLPMTTAAYNQDNPFAVEVGSVVKQGITKASYVLCHQPKSFDWRQRKASPYEGRQVSDEVFKQVLKQLNQIIQL
ncbi:MAG: type II toxin-antitoxin system PemK/MazF family toxin [Gammaproteobacteria bacterium]|nr:type II toxin-antitoxin system PemK/MazF family toxin [Gammaproteobacteria bacterium]